MLPAVVLDGRVVSRTVLFKPSIMLLAEAGTPVVLKQLLTPSWQ
jgi:hypothetical protein